MLANDVDLIDGGATGKQCRRGPALVVERNPGGGSRHEGGPATGEQAENDVVLRQANHQAQNITSPGHTRFVRNGMGTFDRGDALERHGVTVFGVDGPGVDAIAKGAFAGTSHGRCGFAGADNDYAPLAGQGEGVWADYERVIFKTEVGTDQGEGVDGGDSRAENGQSILAPPPNPT